MNDDKEDLENAFEEMLRALKDLPPDVAERIKQNIDKMEKQPTKDDE